MKKHLSIVSIIIFSSLVFAPASVSATSGACSYHSGVNCSAGASYTGNVQCNDGWVNSSVYFSDAEECKISYNSCQIPQIVYSLPCLTESDYTRTQQMVDGMRGTQGAINARRGLLGSSFDTSSTIGQDQLDSCRESIGIYSRVVEERNRCLADSLTPRYSSYQSTLAKITDSTCQQNLGTHGYLNTNTGTCSCNGDYWLKDGGCVEPKLYCSSTLGSNSHPSSDICVCDDGYNGYSGKCTENYKDTKTIDYAVKSWLDQGGRCNNNSHFSVGQEQQCVLYQTNPSTYHWKVLDEVIPEVPPVATTPKIDFTKYGVDPKKTKLNAKDLPVGSYTTLQPIPPSEQVVVPFSQWKAQRTIITANLASSTSSTTPIKSEVQKVTAQKHWYQRLNPFSWFK